MQTVATSSRRDGRDFARMISPMLSRSFPLSLVLALLLCSPASMAGDARFGTSDAERRPPPRHDRPTPLAPVEPSQRPFGTSDDHRNRYHDPRRSRSSHDRPYHGYPHSYPYYGPYGLPRYYYDDVPVIDPQQHYAPLDSGDPVAPEPAPLAAPVTSDPWRDLAFYRLGEALFGFENAIIADPDSALPRVGYALTVALSGDHGAGLRELEQALAYSLADLATFRPEPDLKLIFGELLLDYEDSALMRAMLHFLNASLDDADSAITQARLDCGDCIEARRLQTLIRSRR